MVGTRSLSSGAHSRDPVALPTLRAALQTIRIGFAETAPHPTLSPQAGRGSAPSCARHEDGVSFSLSPFLRGEGRGEGLSPRARFVESPPNPALSERALLVSDPQERGEGYPICIARAAAVWRRIRSATSRPGIVPSMTAHLPPIITRSARCAPQSTSAASGSPWPEKRSSSSLNSARSAALPTAISPSSARPTQAAEPLVAQRSASLWLTLPTP